MKDFGGISFGEFLQLYLGHEYEYREGNDRIVATINDLRPGDPVPMLAVDQASGATTICNAAALWQALSLQAAFVLRCDMARAAREANSECVAESIRRITGRVRHFRRGDLSIASGLADGRRFAIGFADLRASMRGIRFDFLAVDQGFDERVAASPTESRVVNAAVSSLVRTAERRSPAGFVLVGRARDE